MEWFARGLTVVTFVLLCWVVHRGTQVRTDCVNSSFVSLVLVDGARVYNCRFESRLNLRSLYAPLSYATQNKIRSLEITEDLATVFPALHPTLTVEIVDQAPKFFEIGRRFLRLGHGWLEDPQQLRRALVMGTLNSQTPEAYPNNFELEVVADFLSLVLLPSHTRPAHEINEA